MKKIFYSLTAILASAALFTSCVKDEVYVFPPAAATATVVIAPTAPLSSDAVTVTITATDATTNTPSGIQSVTMTYKVNDGAAQKINDGASLAAANGTYTATIPAAAKDAVVSYEVKITNKVGLVTTKTGGYTVGAVVPNGRIYINECDPNAKKWEFYNSSTNAPIDISGWSFRKDGDATTDFAFPTGTSIPANSFVVFTQNAAGSPTFGMSGTKGFKYELFNGTTLIDTFDNLKAANTPYFSIATSETAYSVGRLTDGAGTLVIFTTSSIGSSNNGKPTKP